MVCGLRLIGALQVVLVGQGALLEAQAARAEAAE